MALRSGADGGPEATCKPSWVRFVLQLTMTYHSRFWHV